MKFKVNIYLGDEPIEAADLNKIAVTSRQLDRIVNDILDNSESNEAENVA